MRKKEKASPSRNNKENTWSRDFKRNWQLYIMITINYKDASKSIAANGDVKVRLLFGKDSFEAYLNYDNTRYKGFISGGTYKSDNTAGVKELVSE